MPTSRNTHCACVATWTYVHYPEDAAKSADFTSSSGSEHTSWRMRSAYTKGSANFSTSQTMSSPPNLKLPIDTKAEDSIKRIKQFLLSRMRQEWRGGGGVDNDSTKLASTITVLCYYKRIWEELLSMQFLSYGTHYQIA